MDEYSTLEAVPFEHQRFDGGIQTYPQKVPRDGEAPELLPIEKYENQGMQVYGNTSQLWTHPASVNQKTRRCRMPVRIFYSALIISLILILGAIAGGVAGGIISSHRKHSSNTNGTTSGNQTDPSPTPIANVNILAESKLAACNWTDTNSITHRFIFFQDPTSAIIARRWDSQNRTWTTNNLTDIFSSLDSPIESLGPSTPLSSAAYYSQNGTNEVQLYYLTPQNVVSAVGLYSPLAQPDDWEYSPIVESRLVTAPGSQLASAWTRCWGSNCGQGSLIVMYQVTPDGDITYINGSNFRNPMSLGSLGAAQNSSLALFPQPDYDNPSNGISRLTLLSETLNTPTSGIAQETLYFADGWSSWATVLTEARIPAPEPRFQFAMSGLDNFYSTLFMALLPNGTVTSDLWRNGEREFFPTLTVDFLGGPSVNFSAIAATEEAMFYGVSGDQILQYSMSNQNPPQFNFVESIYP
ncbi:hypothetical protein F5Y16DRAFT_404339 [Xylariaceae sp. FL0255]|nr:hypothetical protein F5Y16DRAFT_404339 [Xylariaceae sp. FL0255]